MAAVAPAQIETQFESKDKAMDGSDMDADGEEDVEMGYDVDDASAAVASRGDRDDEHEEEDGQESEEDAEGSSEERTDHSDAGDEEDFDVENENDGAVGAVKIPEGMDLESDTDQAEGSGAEDENEDEADRNGLSGDSDSSGEPGAVEEWEDASAGHGDADITARNNCIFCKQDEDNYPNEEPEEYLSCAVCGDNAHRQCARDSKSLLNDEKVSVWRCPQCTANSLTLEDNAASLARRLSASSSRLTRDLLPATRGTSKPGSHSIFSNLIVEDDPLDGSRALRKRKSSSEARELQSTTSSKRRKGNSGETGTSASASSSVVDTGEVKQAQNVELEPQPGRESRSAEKNKPLNQEPGARSARPRRQKPEAPRVRPLIREGQRLIIAIRIDLSKIKERPPKKVRRPTITSSGHARFAAAGVMHYGQPFYSLHNQEADESKVKPYGGILSEAEADTSKTFPAHPDRVRFEEARQRAEEDWKIKTAASEAEIEIKGRTSQKISGPPSKIKCINFGGYEIDTWYAAPYPEEYSRNRVLFICEFCLKYMPSDYVAWRHKLKCPAKHPPGDEIYRDKSVSIFEVDGRKNPVYCQNLCLLAKLFLGSKTLYYDVEPFLFYIMTEYDDLGYHFVGYFSKEKRPSSMNNVSCILTLPIHQRKGYGNLLIDFSYLLTRVEQKTGSPEKPLSDMGLVSYRNYWRLVLAYALLSHTDPISISKISDLTGMTADDIIAALEALRALVRDPVTKTYALRLDRAFLRETIEKWEAKGYVKLNPDALVWTPYVLGHYNLTNYDRGAISTVAPREDEDETAVAPEEGIQQQQAASTSENPEIKINGATETIVVPTAVLDPNPDPTLPSSWNPSSPIKQPQPNGIYPAGTPPRKPPSPVPPTRYEIYPPIPGTISRRRTNKSGARRSAYTPGSASVRRDRSRNGSGTPRVNGISPRHITTPTSRKTRSALGKEAEAAKADEEAEGKTHEEGEQDEVKQEKQDEDDDDNESDSDADAEGEMDVEADADADGDEDEDEEDEPEPEPEAEADLSAGEEDADFEPDGDGEVEGDEDDEEDEDAEVDVEAEEDDEDDDAEGESEDAEEEVGEGAHDDAGSEDAEGESDPGDDIAMVDA